MLAVSEGKTTLLVLVVLLGGLFLTVLVGIYKSKKRAKTLMPGKTTEIDKN